MATQARYILIDDIDGSNAKETIIFSVGRTNYEIDLNLQHADEFRQALAKWIKHARKVSGRRSVRGQRAGSAAASDAPAIRAWAKERGIDLADRGRIPTAVREEYEQEKRGA